MEQFDKLRLQRWFKAGFSDHQVPARFCEFPLHSIEVSSLFLCPVVVIVGSDYCTSHTRSFMTFHVDVIIIVAN